MYQVCSLHNCPVFGLTFDMTYGACCRENEDHVCDESCDTVALATPSFKSHLKNTNNLIEFYHPDLKKNFASGYDATSELLPWLPDC